MQLCNIDFHLKFFSENSLRSVWSKIEFEDQSHFYLSEAQRKLSTSKDLIRKYLLRPSTSC